MWIQTTFIRHRKKVLVSCWYSVVICLQGTCRLLAWVRHMYSRYSTRSREFFSLYPCQRCTLLLQLNKSIRSLHEINVWGIIVVLINQVYWLRSPVPSINEYNYQDVFSMNRATCLIFRCISRPGQWKLSALFMVCHYARNIDKRRCVCNTSCKKIFPDRMIQMCIQSIC